MISDERLLIIQAVADGQLSAAVITDAEFAYMADSVFDAALEKLQQNQQLSVFWGEDQPTLH